MRSLLTLFVLVLGWSAPAAEKLTIPPRLVSMPPEFAYIPESAKFVATVHVSEVTRKLNLDSSWLRDTWLVSVCKQFGVALDDIERVTLVHTGLDAESGLVAFTLKEPSERSEFVRARIVGGVRSRLPEKDRNLVPAAKITRHVLNQRTFLATASSETMQLCLQQGTKKQSAEHATIFKNASQHDGYLWCEAAMLSKEADLKFPKEFEGATFSVEVTKEGLAMQMRVLCGTIGAAAWTKQVLPAYIDLLRVQLLALPAAKGVTDFEEPSRLKDNADPAGMIPIHLMRATEKALQTAPITVAGATVTLTLTIPIEAKTLRNEMATVLKQTSTLTLPSPHYLEKHPPQYFPEEPAFPLPKELGYQEPPRGPAPLPMSAPQVTPVPPVPTMPALPIVPVAGTAPKMLMITVANVCRRSAHVFEVLLDGKHELVQAVEQGDASDVQLKSGSRYLAIVTHEANGKPMLFTYTAEKEGSIWLLRVETPRGPVEPRVSRPSRE